MPIVENWSRISGRVEAWEPPAKAGDAGMLTIAVDRVDDVPSRGGPAHRNLLADAAGTTMKVVVPASVAGHLAARNGARAVVEVRRSRSPEKVFAHPDRITVTP